MPEPPLATLSELLIATDGALDEVSLLELGLAYDLALVN
jgi:hypothetical protein